MSTRTALALITVSLGGLWGTAFAQPLAPEQRVLLISPGPELESAARTALEPWALELVIVAALSPGATAPSSNETARALARANRAGAVVWISEDEQGYAVWSYDVETNQVVARPIAGAPPFDGPGAAAVALSIKTLLRHSAAAPEGERYGATSVPGGAQGVEPEPAPTAPSPTPAPPASARAARNSQGPGARDDPIASSRFELEAAGGLRFGLTHPSSVEPRLSAAFDAWPAAGALGLGLRAAVGPPVEVDEPSFRGELLAVSAVASGRFRYVPARGFRLVLAAGPAAHVTELDGALLADPKPVGVARLVPALELELASDWLFAPAFRIGLRGGASFMLRPQRYLVRRQPLLEFARVAFEMGLTAGWLGP